MGVDRIFTKFSKASTYQPYLKRQIELCSRNPRSYFTMVRPQLEYALAVWNPHHNFLIQLLERCGARWTFNDYSRFI